MSIFWVLLGIALVALAAQAEEISHVWAGRRHCSGCTCKAKPKDPAQPARDAGA